VDEEMGESCSGVDGKQNQIIAKGCKVVRKHDQYKSPLTFLAYAHQTALFKSVNASSSQP
jgi:catabolite regulation protein CreA